MVQLGKLAQLRERRVLEALNEHESLSLSKAKSMIEPHLGGNVRTVLDDLKYYGLATSQGYDNPLYCIFTITDKGRKFLKESEDPDAEVKED